MRRNLFFAFSLVLTLVFFSCSSSDDAFELEADIVDATIDNASDLLQDDPKIDNDKIVFSLKKFSGSYEFAPKFVLSKGATIDPPSGTSMDFSEPQNYTVTSENGEFQKRYTVSFIVDDATDYLYTFENVEEDENGNYHTFYELTDGDQKAYSWDTGNKGFSLTLLLQGETGAPEKYPTYQVEDGYKGNGVKMTTKSTGALGASFGAPLAAGNLFIGNFSEITQPDPREGVHFGKTYTNTTAPVELTGYFKYKRGEDFTITDDNTQLTEDIWDAYAILFEKTEGEPNYLQGSFSEDNERIVGMAKLDEDQAVEAEEWTEFSIPFKFKEGKSFDPSKEYLFTIVFSSSKEGDIFNGAEGSTLYIDEVELVTESL